jgi:hyperosmotically inducible protein
MRRLIPRPIKGIVLVLFSSLLVFGAANTAFGAPGAKNQTPAPSSPSYETWLTKEVRHELVMLPYYSVFDNLEYKVDGNKVTLLGQVVRGDVKNDAEKAVRKLEGVEQVDNQIELLPASINDDEIRRAEFRAIYSDSSLQRYAIQSVPPIHIIVKNGHVTLEGAVATEADKNIAGIRANGVPGTFSMTNNLRVDNGG